MRPRVFPAEDADVEDDQDGAREASMRPRVFPAEDSRGPRSDCPASPGFNEAAGIPRGRLARQVRGEWRAASFNEAAGIPRGRPSTGPPRSSGPRRFNEAAGIPRGRHGGGADVAVVRGELQ